MAPVPRRQLHACRGLYDSAWLGALVLGRRSTLTTVEAEDCDVCTVSEAVIAALEDTHEGPAVLRLRDVQQRPYDTEADVGKVPALLEALLFHRRPGVIHPSWLG